MTVCTTLRHNPHMPRMSIACVLPVAALLGLALSACDRRPPPTSTAATVATTAGGDGLQWQARLPCADCDGIEVALLLQQDGRVRAYTLAETYLADADGERFTEHGHWRRRQAWLQLRSDDGARRNFALQADGGLQAADSRGRALSGAGDRMLVPVTAAPPP